MVEAKPETTEPTTKEEVEDTKVADELAAADGEAPAKKKKKRNKKKKGAAAAEDDLGLDAPEESKESVS